MSPIIQPTIPAGTQSPTTWYKRLPRPTNILPPLPFRRTTASKIALWSSRNGLPFTILSPSLILVNSALACGRAIWFFSLDAWPKSSCPSFSWTMLIEESSFRRVKMYRSVAPVTIFSGAWEGDVREGLMDDVRNSIFDRYAVRRGRKA